MLQIFNVQDNLSVAGLQMFLNIYTALSDTNHSRKFHQDNGKY